MENSLKPLPNPPKANKLTPKQDAFCLKYLELGNASDAYRASYSAGKMKPETINRNAFELLQNSKIATRVDFLRAETCEKALLTQVKVISDLIAIKDHCMARDGQGMMLRPAEAIKTLELLGKHLGMFKEKVEVDQKMEIIITGGFTKEMFGGAIVDADD